MEWYVADSYKGMEQIDEPFEDEKGRMQVKLRGTCPRCGGSGHYSYNPMDGTRCFKCGGSGKVTIQVRAYTEKEYNQYIKSKERRAAAEEAKKQSLIDNSEANKMAKLAELGYEIDNPGIYLIGGGNTYDIKDQLKELGCKYNATLGWYSTKNIEVPEGFSTIVVAIDDIYDWNPMSQSFSFKTGAKDVADAALKTLLPKSNSEYIGEIKEKVCGLKVTVTGARTLEGYYGTSTLYTFLNDENVLVWNSTSAKVKLEEGEVVYLNGTIKDHKEYKGVKQTVLTRCTIKAS